MGQEGWQGKCAVSGSPSATRACGEKRRSESARLGLGKAMHVLSQLCRYVRILNIMVARAAQRKRPRAPESSQRRLQLRYAHVALPHEAGETQGASLGMAEKSGRTLSKGFNGWCLSDLQMREGNITNVTAPNYERTLFTMRSN